MPLVRELALQWWERYQEEMPSPEKEHCLAFLEDYILRFLGEEELSKLNQRRLDAYFTQILFEQTYRHQIGRKNVVYGKGILQSIFDYAILQGMANTLPKADLSFRLNIKTKTKPIGCDFAEDTVEQIQKVIACEAASLTGIALGLAYYAGFNREEMLSLQRKHVDFTRNKLLHMDGREVPLEEPLREILQRYMQEVPGSEERLFFISKRKTPFAGPSLSHLIKLAKIKHGVLHEDFGLNALRNRYILNQLQSISSDELPSLAAGLGASPINLINTFGHFLERVESSQLVVAAGV